MVAHARGAQREPRRMFEHVHRQDAPVALDVFLVRDVACTTVRMTANGAAAFGVHEVIHSREVGAAAGFAIDAVERIEATHQPER